MAECGVIPAKLEAFQLMMEGAQALTDVEENGVKVDVPYLDKTISDTTQRIEDLSSQLREDDVYRRWRKKYGTDADLGKRQQFADILFNDMGYECRFWNEGKWVKGQRLKTPSTDKTAFEHITDLPFIPRWLEMLSLKSRLSTDLIGTRRQVGADGFLRPVYNIHFLVSYRSGCRDPNFQNKPVRNKALAKLIRQMYVPRSDDYLFVEVDFGAHEWKGAANFWKDPAMIRDASDPEQDVHRDMAAACYLLDSDEVPKPVRSMGKNKFVFPTLYGSTYRATGGNLWDAIRLEGLTLKDGTSLHKHLARKGISGKEEFVAHMEKVDEAFNARYPVWREKKVQWWNDYLRNGEFPLSTGFVCRGIYSYNDIMNYPVQGPSFHILLWSLIQINAWLKKHKMRSKVIGEIHDSILLDLHRSEVDDVLTKLVSIMTEETARHFPWVVVRPEAEVEASFVNWFEKRPWICADGAWRQAA